MTLYCKMVQFRVFKILFCPKNQLVKLVIRLISHQVKKATYWTFNGTEEVIL